MNLFKRWNDYANVANAILFAATATILLFLARSMATGTARFYFMAWNLVLSLLAVAAALLFTFAWAAKHKVLSYVFFGVWLLLLPNTFYMLTDFIHVQDTGEINMLFDIVLIGLFAMNGFIHGLLSVYLVHKRLLSRFKPRLVHASVALIFLASSFAVDMGRYLRWNSWDVLLHPRALLFDVSNTLLNPSNYHRSFLITGAFFVACGSLYMVLWSIATLQWGTSWKK